MFKDILSFLKSLSFIDYVFFFTVIFLIILVVSLIYFIKINEEIMKSEDKALDPDNLKETIKILSEEKEKKPVEFTSYEKEQEEKAIISYEELLNNKSTGKLNYASEDEVEGISVKKIDLNNLVTPTKESSEQKLDCHVISLQKEEEFLKALKELQRNLS